MKQRFISLFILVALIVVTLLLVLIKGDKKETSLDLQKALDSGGLTILSTPSKKRP